MPKDEFDFQDPFELNGVAFLAQEDTTPAMAECFVEEYLRMGYGHKQILALFRNPHYLGPHLAYEKLGLQAIQHLIAEVFARWGRTVAGWEAPAGAAARPNPAAEFPASTARGDAPATSGGGETVLDPMGLPAPHINR